MKVLAVIVLLIASLIYLSSYNEEKKIEKEKQEEQEQKQEEQERELACSLDPICQDKEAVDLSVLSDDPVQSTTGAYYFKGERCKDVCAGHIKGYRWAEKLGVSKEAGCEGPSESFAEGCLTYVEDRLYELSCSEDELYEQCEDSQYYGDDEQYEDEHYEREY